MGKTFFVKLDVNDFATEADSMESPEDRSDWLSGFSKGIRGIMKGKNWTEAMSAGWLFGAGLLNEAEEFRVRRSSAGQKGNQKRWGDRKQVAKVSQCDRNATDLRIANVSPVSSKQLEERREKEELSQEPVGSDQTEPPPLSLALYKKAEELRSLRSAEDRFHSLMAG